MSYFLSHWHGKIPLGISLWINMIGLFVIISYIELLVLSQLSVAPSKLITLTLVSLIITRLIVFPWQLIGLVRAIEHDYVAQKNILKTRALQAFVLISVLITMVYVLEVIQGAFFYKSQLEPNSLTDAKLGYTLEVSQNQRQLTIIGDLDIGVTNAVRSSLISFPQISSIILQSQGGNIYEGRGLAKIFTELDLDTYVYEECSSACVIAFIGGKQRFLGAKAKLGFHQYRVDTKKYSLFVPIYSLDVEQGRDLDLLKARGVNQVFLDKMFDQPAKDIWFPDRSTLREAGVVNSNVEPL